MFLNGSMPAGAIFSPDFLPVVSVTPDADYASSLESITPGVTSLVEQESRSSGSDWIDSLSRIVTVLAVGQQQRDLLRVQVDRARQGLPPLNVGQYAGGAQVGLSSDTKWLLGLSVAAIVAVMLFKR